MPLKYSTYNSLLTGKRTMFVASIGKCGYEGYRELQVVCIEGGVLVFKITDGYKYLTFGVCPSLKHGIAILKSFYSGK